MLTRRQLALVFFAWALFGWLHGTQLYLGVRAEVAVPPPELSYAPLVAWDICCWLLWAILTPLVVWLSRRVPVSKHVRPIALHLAASALVPFVRVLGIGMLSDLLRPAGEHQPFLERYFGMVSVYFHIDLIIYWAIVGVVQAIDSRRRLRERELLLAQAQLANLRLQVQPHFLFNTLHTVASLVRDGSSHAAVTMIAGLSDLLRYSLDNAGRDRVPLSEELEVVRRYLDIQETRFSDQLQVRVMMEPETQDATVPTLLLQPLVENAVRHGRPNHLGVHARREDGMLVVEVENDGASLPGNLREGIGLSSTRRRLEQLYGPRASLELANREPAGVVARVRIPFTREPA